MFAHVFNVLIYLQQCPSSHAAMHYPLKAHCLTVPLYILQTPTHSMDWTTTTAVY